MMTLAIFTFVGAWNNFLWPLIATTEDAMRTLPLAISTMRTAYDTDVGLVMAGAAVTFLPPFLFYLILQSKFEEGITQDAGFHWNPASFAVTIESSKEERRE